MIKKLGLNLGKKNPTMRSGKTVTLDEDSSGAYGSDAFEMSTTRDAFNPMIRFVKLTVGVIIACVLIAVAALAIITVTVGTNIKVGETDIAVLRNEHNVMSIPPTTMIVASATKVDDSITGKWGQLFNVPGASVVKIIGGPNAQTEQREDGLYINGVKAPTTQTVKNQFLDRTYLAECFEGACTPGTLIFVPTTNIIGSVKGERRGYNILPYNNSTTTETPVEPKDLPTALPEEEPNAPVVR